MPKPVGDGDFNAAIPLLESILRKIHGDEAEKDWMDPSDEKTALAEDVNLQIALLM